MPGLDDIDRAILNTLQDGFPVCEAPFERVAIGLGLDEQLLMGRVQSMLDNGLLNRFGPIYHPERMGGGLTLAAMAVPADRFDEVAGVVNAFPEVAHNYEREHRLNMWFVISTEVPERIGSVISDIESKTGLPVYNMPKEHEFYVGLKFDV